MWTWFGRLRHVAVDPADLLSTIRVGEPVITLQSLTNSLEILPSHTPPSDWLGGANQMAPVHDELPTGDE